MKNCNSSLDILLYLDNRIDWPKLEDFRATWQSAPIQEGLEEERRYLVSCMKQALTRATGTPPL